MPQHYPMFAIGSRLVTIVEVSPDCFRYLDCLTDELSGGSFNGTKIPLAVAHLARLESEHGGSLPPITKG